MIASFQSKAFRELILGSLKVQLLKKSSHCNFETFVSDKPMIAFSSSSNFLSTDFVKSLIASNYSKTIEK